MSTTSTLDSQSPPAHPTGLRAQLHHLIPKHALFHLSSVPLVHGEFGVRWKFKNVHSSPRGLLDKVKPKGKARATPEGDADSQGSGSADTSNEEPSAPNLTVPSSSSHRGHRHHSSLSSAVSSAVSVVPEDPAHITARGQTHWLPLRDHSVTWEHTLDTAVQMSIERDTLQLLPHPFKLVVMQRSTPPRPSTPRAGLKGLVTRRHLLRDSKTNATLKVSIHIVPVLAHPMPQYIAPPLPAGEILGGIGGLLASHEDVYRTRPRALDLYAPPEVESPSRSLFRGKSPPPKPPFDVHALPLAYGPRPTESLIEALFNPVPVRDARLTGPFTHMSTRTTSSYFAASRPSMSSSSSSVYTAADSVYDRSGTTDSGYDR
ncbi:hypothetical protein C8J57DRAFT_1273268, partial [Mycena rebaudengoi]